VMNEKREEMRKKRVERCKRHVDDLLLTAPPNYTDSQKMQYATLCTLQHIAMMLDIIDDTLGYK